jgi:diguanylate cyclase
VELNGGRIGVESQTGQGSTFWILMPIASAEAVGITKTETPDVKARLDGLSTLVVDDNVDTCEVIKHVLMSAGATVRTANSVKDGIAELENNFPDLILTDLAIPGESGLALIQHVRNMLGKNSEVPIMVLSACAFETDKTAALNAGASLFLPKPFKPNEVINAARQLTLTSAMKR